jgi:serine/threonine-protein kinase
MELGPGDSMRQRLRHAGGPLSLSQLRVFTPAFGEAVAAVHRSGLLHLDLRPEHVLFDGRRATLCGFGSARGMIRSGLVRGDAARQRPAGPAEYRAPELHGQQAFGFAADVYAVGVVLYELYCGILPAGGEPGETAATARHRQEPRPPRGLRPEIDGSEQRIILRCLAGDPARRYRSGEELHAAVLRAMRQITNPWIRVARLSALGAAGALLVLLAWLLVVAAWRS